MVFGLTGTTSVLAKCFFNKIFVSLLFARLNHSLWKAWIARIILIVLQLSKDFPQSYAVPVLKTKV